MNTSETLNLAADLIEKYGWLQGTYGNPGRGFCASGATEYAADYNPGGWYDANRQVIEYLRLDPTIETLAGWNDKPDRTKDEVIAALRAAAEKVK